VTTSPSIWRQRRLISSDTKNLTETNAAVYQHQRRAPIATDSPAPRRAAWRWAAPRHRHRGAWTYTASSAHNEFQGRGVTYTDSFNVASADGT
jgi:hypothetical protein